MSEYVKFGHGEERENVIEQSRKIVEVFRKPFTYKEMQLPEKEQIEETADILFKMADPVYGGMKGIPKFPIGYQCQFYVELFIRKKDSRALFLS